jgi:hypothetical protein
MNEAADEEAATGSDSPEVESVVAGSAEPQVSPIGEDDAPPRSEFLRCWLAGPVADDQTSDELAAHFAAASIGMDLILRTVEADPDYWVYLPTDGSQAEVRRLSGELRQGGMENFPISSGPLAGGLSLGLFRSVERARVLRDDLLNRGYSADIYPRPRYRDEAWIALDDAGREALGWPAIVGAVPGFERVILEERSCDR